MARDCPACPGLWPRKRRSIQERPGIGPLGDAATQEVHVVAYDRDQVDQRGQGIVVLDEELALCPTSRRYLLRPSGRLLTPEPPFRPPRSPSRPNKPCSQARATSRASLCP